MQRLTLVLAAAAMLAACTNQQSESADQTETAAAKIDLPYEVSYSSSFKIGNPAYATMVVQGSWKDWEDNNLDNMRTWVADTVVAYHSDNEVVHGVDSLMASWKRARARYSAVKPTINAVMATHSTDHNDDWVLVWATEIDTREGVTDTTEIMETWHINKGGKADVLYQYARENRKD